MNTLRVGVNLCWLVPGVVGGSEDLLTGWLEAMADHPEPGIELTLFGAPAVREVHPRLAACFDWVDAPVPKAARAKAVRVVLESTWLARQARRRRFDVVHHAGGVVPLRHPGAVVLTVHDIQPLQLPQNFSLVKRRYVAAMLPRSVRAADVVTVTTRFVRDGVVEQLGADPQRCMVVPPALTTVAAGGEESASLRGVAGIGPRYVIYPAIAYPHKNHKVLLDALAGLRHPDLGDVDLVLTGAVGPCDDALARQVVALGLGTRVHRLGRVARSELDSLVSGALAVVFPSRYEGFGLPTLQAMANGVAVIAAQGTALSEVVASGGVHVDPDDAGAWAAAITAVARDTTHREALVAAGRRRAASFRRSDSAGALHGAYRFASEVAASSGSGSVRRRRRRS